MRTRFLLATAAAATLAFAAPAAANPFTSVGPLTGPAGQVTLGGAASNVPAEIDWDLVGGVPNPVLRGRLFMDNVPGAQARVRVQYYDDAVSHTLLNTQAGPIRNGVNGVDVFGTNIGPEAGSAHAHVQLLVNGAVVDTATCTMGGPAC
jgi:hypothetical protein